MTRPVSRHKADPPPRYQTRYGRVGVLVVSVLTTGVALLGGVGVLPSAADDESPERSRPTVAVDLTAADELPTEPATTEPSEPTESIESSEVEETDEPLDDAVPSGTTTSETEVSPLPSASGEGKRVVFSETEQRVWLVGSAGKIKRTYPVSGSLTDNLDPGTYQVYSRSEDAVGIDDSGTMKWFVRFTQGPSGAAIGFHTIPVDEGERVQGTADLGTPQSHGCIRQATPDAVALWEFAPLGTTVVVV